MMSANYFFRKALQLAGLLAAVSFAHAAEGPPLSDGVISNPALVKNQAIAKAQAVGAITTFMGKGTQECDKDGKNCRSLFGADDSLDYSSVQLMGQSTTGIQSFAFLSGSSDDEQMDSNTIASQTGTLVLACGDSLPKTVAGVAFRMTNCIVNPQGDAQITFQACSAPARGNPIVPPDNVMACSSDPASPNFRPKPGYSCEKPACSTEPVGSLNGWSQPMTISYEQSVAQTGSDDAKSKNGLGLLFYPALGSGIPANFAADSDTMTAVKIVQTAISPATNQSAVGLRVAFRHKTQVTKEMMVEGASSVPNPGEKSAAWETIEKLQGNALIPQYQKTYAANGSECLQQIQGGLATDGIVSVCDQTYTNESGIKPKALTAQMAAEGQNCGTTAQCLQEVVNTNTWEQTCRSDVPLSIRKCTTKQDYTIEALSYTRTRTTEICTEERTKAVYSCRTYAEAVCRQAEGNCASGGIIPNSASVNNGSYAFTFDGANLTLSNLVTATWTVTKADFVFTIKGLDRITNFRINSMHSDNWIGLRINDQYVGTHTRLFNGFNRASDRLAIETVEFCDADAGCYTYDQVRYSATGVHGAETGGDFKSATDVDLLPYLREGVNVITMNVINGGGPGYGHLYGVAHQQCEAECTFPVTNECSGYESAR